MRRLLKYITACMLSLSFFAASTALSTVKKGFSKLPSALSHPFFDTYTFFIAMLLNLYLFTIIILSK